MSDELTDDDLGAICDRADTPAMGGTLLEQSQRDVCRLLDALAARDREIERLREVGAELLAVVDSMGELTACDQRARMVFARKIDELRKRLGLEDA
ncbi:MAG: hypothetical protein ACLFVJ_22625 [Persicimonas sp.]